MTRISFSEEGWADYLYWQLYDKKKIEKINSLLQSVDREGQMKGIGKPEKLLHRRGYSRRIDDTNRLIYLVDENQIAEPCS